MRGRYPGCSFNQGHVGNGRVIGLLPMSLLRMYLKGRHVVSSTPRMGRFSIVHLAVLGLSASIAYACQALEKDNLDALTAGGPLPTSTCANGEALPCEPESTSSISVEEPIADDDDSVGAGCFDTQVNFSTQIPTIVLLLDQSGSMSEPFDRALGEEPTRWEALQDVLINPVSGVIPRLQTKVEFGLTLYSSPPTAEPVFGKKEKCPALTTVDAAISNSDAIVKVYESSRPKLQTPTGESLEAVARELFTRETLGQKVIVLATDGEPDTCEDPNADDSSTRLARARGVSLDAVEKAYSWGIQTYTISLGNSVAKEHLQELANAGRGFDEEAEGATEVFTVDEREDLVGAFAEIVNGVRACNLELEAVVLESGVSRAEVTLDEVVLKYEDPNGWRLNSERDRLELLGQACKTVLLSEKNLNLRATFPCDDPI